MSDQVRWRSRRRHSAPILLVLLVGLIASLLSGILVANDLWPVAAALLVALPGFILLHRYPWLAVLLWIFVSPFLVIAESNLLRRVYWVVHRGLPPLALVIIAVSHVMRIQRRKIPKMGYPEAAMAGYLALTVLSVLFQSSSRVATLYIVYDRIFVPICLYLLVRMVEPEKKDLDRLFLVAFFIAVSQAIFGLIYWGAPGLLPSNWLGDQPRATGSVRSVGLYTVVLIFAGIMMIWKGTETDSGLKKSLFLGAFGLAYIGVLVSFSRGSWLGGLLVMGVLFLLYPRLIFRYVLVGGLLIVVLAGSILAPQLRFAEERLSSESTALSRLPVMYASIQMTAAKPVFGWGYGNFDDYDRQFQGRVGEIVSPGEKDQSSHNFFLSRLAEQGIVGFFLMVAPALWYFAKSVRLFAVVSQRAALEKRQLVLLWLIILNYIVVHNFLDMIIFYAHGLYWITLGLIAVKVHRLESQLGARLAALRRRPGEVDLYEIARSL